MAIKGGKKLDKFLRDAKTKRGVRGVDAGFYSTAKYPDGTPVTNVALWNEYGVERNGRQHIPERPFMRQAIPRMEEPILDVLKAEVDPKTMIVEADTAGRVGLAMQAEIQSSITNLKRPANAPSTIQAKKSSNPLLDTAVLRGAATFRVLD